MTASSVRYTFSQRFDVPAEKAFRWSVDYQPDDLALMKENGKRSVEWLSEDTVIVTDTLISGKTRDTKKRLVRINPERMSWTTTHLTGSNKHSQFLYEIVPEGKNGSRLNFTGLHLNYGKKASKAETGRLAKAYAEADGAGWVLLAAAMRKDLGVRR